MPEEAFYPALYPLLRQFLPGLLPGLDGFLPALWSTFFSSLPLHPGPGRLNRIKIRAIARPKKALDLVLVVDVLLDIMVMCWSLVFLYEGSWPCYLAGFGKRDQLRY